MSEVEEVLHYSYQEVKIGNSWYIRFSSGVWYNKPIGNHDTLFRVDSIGSGREKSLLDFAEKNNLQDVYPE